MTPHESELFQAYKGYFEEKFSHFETKIDTVDKKTDKILIQTTETNGRVTKLEHWKHEIGGVAKGATKTTIAVSVILGGVINILAQYLWNK